MDFFALSVGARLLAGAFFFALLTWYFQQRARAASKALLLALSIFFALLFWLSAWFQLVSLAILGALVIQSLLISQKSPKSYTGALAKIEGGGIKRGLTPSEVAIVLGKPLKLTLTLVIFEMLRKGFLTQAGQDPFTVEVAEPFQTHGLSLSVQERGDKRRKAAQQIPSPMQLYEEAFLEIFETNPSLAVNEIDYGVALQPLVRFVAGRVGGFDLEETRDYYRLIIDRAPKEARTDGALTFEREKVFDRNFGFVLLGENFINTFDQADYSYIPKWMRKSATVIEDQTFAHWAMAIIDSMQGVVDEEEIQLGISKEMDLLSATLMNEIAQATFYG